MKKILILINDTTGLINHREELIQALSDNGYKIYVCSPEDSGVPYLVEKGVNHIAIDIKRRSKNIFQDYKLFKNYKRVISKIRPNIILTYTIKPNVFGGLASKRFRIPYIGNITGLGTSFNQTFLLKTFVSFLYRRAFKNISYVFFQNESNKEIFLNQKIIHSNYTVLPGSGVNIDRFKILPYPNNSKIRITFLGRIMKEKGIGELLDAIELIDLNKITIQIVGSFEDQHLKDRVNKLVKDKKITLLPFTREIIPILAESDAIINPSYHEGMSNVLLESAASARPVLASNIPGCIETFDDGISGISFEPKNVVSLVETINKFASMSYENRKKMGLRGREKVEKEFDRNIVIKKYTEKIEEILKEKN